MKKRRRGRDRRVTGRTSRRRANSTSVHIAVAALDVYWSGQEFDNLRRAAAVEVEVARERPRKAGAIATISTEFGARACAIGLVDERSLGTIAQRQMPSGTGARVVAAPSMARKSRRARRTPRGARAGGPAQPPSTTLAPAPAADDPGRFADVRPDRWTVTLMIRVDSLTSVTMDRILCALAP